MPSATSNNKDFEALYLQRITAELAEDLEFLRTSEDFKTVAPASSQGETSSKPTGANNNKHADDSPLEMLIAALRQGAEMFGPEDQKRIVGNGAP